MVPMSVPELLRHLGPVFRSGEAVTAGVSWRDLYALRDGGQIIELSRGLSTRVSNTWTSSRCPVGCRTG